MLVSDALLMGVAVIAWMRVGAPWLPFIFAPVFYGTLLPLWFLWLVGCSCVSSCRSGRRIRCIDLEELVMMQLRGDERHKGRLATAAMLPTWSSSCGRGRAGRCAGCARGPPPGAIHLRIRCDTEIVYFKVGLQVSIGAVFEAFAERKRVGVDQLRFRVEGADRT